MSHIQDILLWACYLHALAAVMAVASILYWVQFHYKIGPTAINVSRVVIDVVTMFVIYILINFAFAVGLSFVHSTYEYVANNSSMSTSHVFTLMLQFGWSTLAPGPPGNTDIEFMFAERRIA